MTDCITQGLLNRLDEMREDPRIKDCHSLTAINAKLGPFNKYNIEFRAMQSRIKRSEQMRHQQRLDGLEELAKQRAFKTKVAKATFLYLNGATQPEACKLAGVTMWNFKQHLAHIGRKAGFYC